jgi:trehalose 6-phosphate phosphatase
VTTAARFAALLADPTGSLVACDYDGTLAPIVEDPGAAVPAPGAVEALARLALRVARVAVVTGRPAGDAVRLGGLERVRGVVVLGLYGAQRWSDGVLVVPDPPPGLAAADSAVVTLLASADPGLWLERKGGSLAVHSRQAADPSGALERLLPVLTALAEQHGLQVVPGRLVLELLPAGAVQPDKGSALSGLVREVAARSVLFIGDDLGDLAAFEVCHRLRAAGVAAWSVAAANHEAPEVAQRADMVVDGPGGVVELLAELAQLLG